MLRVNYVTSSQFKKEEIQSIIDNCFLPDGTSIKGNFDFKIFDNHIHERLEVDLEKMVMYEVKEAYNLIKIPCIVEHAGLIFEKYKSIGYPGGLTKPMWNTLKENFLSETNSSKIAVIAKAVVGYCNGKTVELFSGETSGILSSEPKGDRTFYWDTVFIPDTSTNLTYAEIVEKHGLAEKITKHSQSAKALISFLDFLRKNGNGELWS